MIKCTFLLLGIFIFDWKLQFNYKTNQKLGIEKLDNSSLLFHIKK